MLSVGILTKPRSSLFGLFLAVGLFLERVIKTKELTSPRIEVAFKTKRGIKEGL